MVMEITWPPNYLMQINKEKLDFVNFGDILSNLKKNQPNKNITKTKKPGKYFKIGPNYQKNKHYNLIMFGSCFPKFYA